MPPRKRLRALEICGCTAVSSTRKCKQQCSSPAVLKSRGKKITGELKKIGCEPSLANDQDAAFSCVSREGAGRRKKVRDYFGIGPKQSRRDKLFAQLPTASRRLKTYKVGFDGDLLSRNQIETGQSQTQKPAKAFKVGAQRAP